MAGSRGSAAIACSLRKEELHERRTRWRSLRAAEVNRVRTQRGVRLVFRNEPGVVEELQTLVGLERECCGFAAWSLRPDGDWLVLDVTGDRHEAIAAVQAMFGEPDRKRDER